MMGEPEPVMPCRLREPCIDLRIGLERDDCPGNTDIAPQHHGICADIDNAIHAEMGAEPPQRDNLAILMLPPGKAEPHREPAIPQLPAITCDPAHACRARKRSCAAR